MAKYAVSPQGVDALHKLAADLTQAVDDVEISSSRLVEAIDSLEPDLGIYYKEILLIVREILSTLKEFQDEEDGILYLIRKRIPHLIAVMEELIRMGLCSGEDEEPAEKVLVLKRSR